MQPVQEKPAVRYLTPDEIGFRLGVNKKHVERLIAIGELKSVDIGLGARRRLLRVPESEVEQFLERRARP